MNTTIRTAVPQMSVAVSRSKAKELQISTGQVFQTLATYVGSSFVLDPIARNDLPPGTSLEWRAVSYQEQAVGDQTYMVAGLAILLVYLVLAGQ